MADEHGDETIGATVRTVDVQSLVAGNSLKGLPALVALLLGAVLLMDGFDLAVVGFAAPAIVRQFGLDTAQMGYLLAAGNAGLGLGAVAGGIAGDRIGRRPVLLAGVLLYSGGTALCAVAPDATVFLLLRVVAGFGLGVVAPTVATVLIETLPGRWRALLSVLAYTMITVGAVLCGIAAKLLLPVTGWQALFLLGGLVPLLLIWPVLIMVLPETPAFLVKARRPAAAVAAALNRLCRTDFDGAEQFRVEDGAPVGRPSLADLFRHHLRDTVALWLFCGGVMLTSVAFTNTGTLVFTRMGLNAGDAVSMVLVYTVSGLAGGVLTSIGVRWFGSRRTVGAVGLAALLALLVLSVPQGASFLMPLVAIAGFGLGGLTVSSFPLAANAYPVAIRTGGAGAAAAVSRVGAVIGAAAVGQMLAIAEPVAIFRALAAVMAVCLIAVLLVRRHLPPVGPQSRN